MPIALVCASHTPLMERGPAGPETRSRVADAVREEAGRGGTEVLCWTAAFAALSMGGPFVVEQSFYEAIPGWIAGFATMAARKAEAAR
jgi:hypothetical protein